jgi:CheY-like chemotaxis protein
MDALMPVMDGYEATAALKADPETKEVPILFWTCNGSVPEVRERALRVGADDLADKPLELSRLRRQIETWLSRASKV